jgi:hypothetical protein
MRRPELRSPLARAVVPVAAGIVFFGILGLFLWGVAAYISGSEGSDTLAPTTFQVGSTKTYASIIEEEGPLILPDLLRANGRRTIVLDHTGDDPQHNWQIYMAYPADRDVDCKVTQIRTTRTFTDCDGREIAVEDLALPPRGVLPRVFADGTLELDLVPDDATAPPVSTSN